MRTLVFFCLASLVILTGCSAVNQKVCNPTAYVTKNACGACIHNRCDRVCNACTYKGPHCKACWTCVSHNPSCKHRCK